MAPKTRTEQSLPTIFIPPGFVPLATNFALHLTKSTSIVLMRALVKKDLKSSGKANDLKSNVYLFFTTPKEGFDGDKAKAIKEKYNSIGFEAHINYYKCSNNGIQLHLQAVRKVSFLAIVEEDPFFIVRAVPVEEYGLDSKKAEFLIKQIATLIKDIQKNANDLLDKDLIVHFFMGSEDSDNYIVFIDGLIFHNAISNDPILSREEFIELSLELDISKRLVVAYRILKYVYETYKSTEEFQKLQRQVDEEIDKKVKERFGEIQREYVLRQKMKSIQAELVKLTGEEEDPNNMSVFQKKIDNADMSEDVKKTVGLLLARLSHMSSGTQEARVLRDYIDILCSIPWSKKTEDNLDIVRVRKILDEGHYGLEKVKKRLIEDIAVRKLKPNKKGSILCFYGPPGVGKTSLGKAIAEAMGRKFHRISFGGVRDEAEIRGHRRTYIGALPGRFIRALICTGVKNPLIMLDEVDKLGHEAGQANVANALLEVLDPEQNCKFEDHYVELPVDLSDVLFICTVNELGTIPQALRDRLEIIELPGYVEQEKLQIVKRHLLPKQLEENGVLDRGVLIPDEVISQVIRSYTSEAGVRSVERLMATIIRTVAVAIVTSKIPKIKITLADLPNILGPIVYENSALFDKNSIGIVNGLFFSYSGGGVLLVEVAKMIGNGKINITGNLKDVIRESAMVAFTASKKYLNEQGFDISIFSDLDFHIHFPLGAIPKDGPSAGAAIALAVISSVMDIPVKNDIAMTGEINLRGRIMPIGGVKQKVLGAHRAGCKTVLLPKANQKDEGEIPTNIKNELKILFVSTLDEVVAHSLKEGP